MNLSLKTLEWLARLILIVYGLIYIIGILWHLGAIYLVDLVVGLILIFTSIPIGFFPLTPKNKTKSELKIYMFICCIGVLVCIYSGLSKLVEEHRNWSSFIEPFVLSACFITMMAIKNRKKV